MTLSTDQSQIEQKDPSPSDERAENPWAAPSSNVEGAGTMSQWGKIWGGLILGIFGGIGLLVTIQASRLAHRILHGNWEPGRYCMKVILLPVGGLCYLPLMMLCLGVGLRLLSLIWPTQYPHELAKPPKLLPSVVAGCLFFYRLLGGQVAKP